MLFNLTGKWDLPVSAGVRVSVEMPRSGNEVMSKQRKQIANIRFDNKQKQV
jgi:hypothetical protein